MPGTLFVVATPIGNLEDITARALRVLREVTLIAAEDTRRTAHLLARYAISTPTTSLHEHNERKKAAALIARLQRGESVALVSDAGTPTISDPGHWLIRVAIDAGIRVEPIPGPSAALAALAASGIASDTFTFLGFPPTRSNDRNRWLEELRDAGRPVIFFEAPHRIVETLRQIHSLVGNCQIAVARELTKAHEELVRGPILDVLASLPNPRGEFTVIVEIGHKTNYDIAREASGSDLAAELGEITEHGGLSRRQAINALARRHRVPPNQVYAAIERVRKSAK